jgi:hypothetical protein
MLGCFAAVGKIEKRLGNKEREETKGEGRATQIRQGRK